QPLRRLVHARRIDRSHHRGPRLGAHPVPLPVQGRARRRTGHRDRHRVRHPERAAHVRGDGARRREDRAPSRGAAGADAQGRSQPPGGGGARQVKRLVVLVWLGALAALLAQALAADTGRQESISLSLPSVVLVLAVDARGGELEAVAAGSGTILSSDGAVLTNHHILYDAREGRLYDLFLVARYRGADRDP